MKFEVFHRRNLLGKKRWYFRIRAENGQIVAQSEAYSRKIDAVSTAQSVRQSVSVAEIIEIVEVE